MTYSGLIFSSIYKFWDTPLYSEYPIDYDIKYCGKDIANYIAKYHNVFKGLRIKHGDRVAICAENSCQWIIVFLALTTYGAIPVPITHMDGENDIRMKIEHSRSIVLFTTRAIFNYLFPNESSIPSLLLAIYSLEPKYIASHGSALFSRIEGAPSVDSFDINLHPLDFEKYAFERKKDDKLFCINYTSGTMSNPKGVMISEDAFMDNLLFVRRNFNFKVGDTSLVLLPMSHMFSIITDVFGAITFGGTAYFYNGHYKISELIRGYRKIKPSIFILVPLLVDKIIVDTTIGRLHKWHLEGFYKTFKPMMDKLLGKAVKWCLGGRFNEIILGGTSLPIETQKILTDMGFPITLGYGMTECAPVISYSNSGEFKLGTCGKIRDSYKYKFSKDGELMLKGVSVTNGYIDNAEATADVFEHGWFKTGDLGYVDNDGYLHITGRVDDIIVKHNGEKVNPQTITDVLNTFPTVEDSIVVYDKENDIISAKVYSKDYDAVAFINIEANKILPYNAQLTAVEIVSQPFKKTMKGEVKRK